MENFKQENTKSPPKQACAIKKSIFDCEAKFRTQRMLDRALLLQRKRVNEEKSEKSVTDLNDTVDFREVPKFRSRLRLKTKNTSSSSASDCNIIVIDEENSSQDSTDAAKDKVATKERKVLEGLTKIKDKIVTLSTETDIHKENGTVNDGLRTSSAEENINHNTVAHQTCPLCGVDFDSFSYRIHRMDCLKKNFSKPG